MSRRAKKIAAPVNRKSEALIVRFPDGMRDKIKRVARKNMRSMNSEIISVLAEHLHNHMQKYGVL